MLLDLPMVCKYNLPHAGCVWGCFSGKLFGMEQDCRSVSSFLSNTSHPHMPIQLRKTDMLQKGQEGHVCVECDVLKSTFLMSSQGGM